MERLTKRYDTHVAVICENCDKKLECNGGAICGEVLREHLAAYEDTELEPEEVQIVAEMFSAEPYVSIMQVSNLVKAYREGRVEILLPNDPLTTDELREMDGEPVWILSLDDGYGEWVLFQKIDLEETCAFAVIGATRDYSDGYGKTWLAYRRKLKEGTK